MEDVKQLIGERIRRFRKERGLSQEELGEKAGLHYTYIGGIERGEKNASVDALSRIAESLGVELVELFPKPKRQDYNRLKSSVLESINGSSPEMVRLFADLIEDIKELNLTSPHRRRGK